MPCRSISDLMVSPGIRVRRGTGLEEVAALLAEHAITAVPVVDDNECPVGLVSESDLRRGRVLRAERSRTGSRTGAATAGEVMTSPAVTARPEWTVVTAARAMERRRVKRLPVVNEAEQLVGFLSRGDLMRVFLRPDQAVRQEIVADILNQVLGLGPSQVTVGVNDGRVTLLGIVDSSELLPVVDRLVGGVDGVVEVRNHLASRSGPPTRAGSAAPSPY